MDNLEAVLQCLNDFQKAKEKEIGPELDRLLSHIAKTGRTEFSWHLLKPLIAYKLEKVLNDFFENNSSTNDAYSTGPTSKSKTLYPDVQKLISSLNCFSGTPFTIQRLCELITEPKRYYKTTDKFLRGVEKNIMVVSTVQPDGVLITRSVQSVLTNGGLSPTRPDTAPTSPNLAPLTNSPLNTITQENNASPVGITSDICPDEKAKTPCSEQNCENMDESSKIQDNETTTPVHIENMQDTMNTLTHEQKELCSSESDGEAVLTEVTRENNESCVENGASERESSEMGTNETCEEEHLEETNDIPREEKARSEDEKMADEK